MEINTPKYAKHFLKSILGKDVSINDYRKPTTLDGRYSERGVMVLGWLDPHHVRIQFKPDNTIYFNIEAEERTIVNSVWKLEDVDESTYEYFGYILKTHIDNRNKIADHARNFNSKHWIPLNKKLSKLV